MDTRVSIYQFRWWCQFAWQLLQPHLLSWKLTPHLLESKFCQEILRYYQKYQEEVFDGIISQFPPQESTENDSHTKSYHVVTTVKHKKKDPKDQKTTKGYTIKRLPRDTVRLERSKDYWSRDKILVGTFIRFGESNTTRRDTARINKLGESVCKVIGTIHVDTDELLL